MNRIFLIPFSIIILSFSFTLNSQKNDLGNYFSYFFSQDDSNAATIALRNATNSSSIEELDYNLFHFYDTISYSEQAAKGLTYLNILESCNPLCKTSPLFLHLKTLTAYMSGNEISFKQSTSNSHSFDNFTALGPFFYNDLNSFHKRPLPSPTKKIFYNSKKNVIYPFISRSNQFGSHNISNYLTTKNNSFFFFTKSFTLTKDDDYIFSIGKTGYCDIYIDRKKIASESHRHFYAYDQYFLKQHLSKGLHTITLKVSTNTINDIIFSVKLFTPQTLPWTKPLKTDSLYSYTDIFFPDISDSKKRAYLALKKGFYGETNYIEQILTHMDTDAVSLYLLSLSATDKQEKIRYLNRLSKISPSARVYYDLSEIYLQNGFLDKSLHYIKLSRELSSSNFYYDLFMYKFFKKKQWYFAAEKHAKHMASYSPLYSMYLKADIAIIQKQYDKALEYTSILLQQNSLNENNFINKYKIISNNEQIHKKIDFLFDYSTQFPNNINIMNSIANLYYINGDYSSALNILSSAKQSSPQNSETMFLISKNYLALHKNQLAKQYAIKSKRLSPENKIYTTFYNTHFDDNEFLNKYIEQFDQSKAEQIADTNYNNEPVVILLHETVEKILPDSSTIKRIRKIYKVYDSDEASELNNIQFTVDNSRESVLELDCFVTTDGQTHSYTRINKESLSDPESSLYYDITLWSVHLPVVQNGSIITVDYTINKSAGEKMRGYYGEKFYFSDYYRIINGYNKVITPLTMKLTSAKSSRITVPISITQTESNRIYSLSITDQEPVKQEKNSPSYFNRIPHVAYTSFKNWDQFYTWYAPLLKTRSVITSQMRADISTLLKDAKDDKEKISIIYQYITNRTRYVGFEIGIGGIQPRFTNNTYESHLGDCKDIALLLASIYKEFGYDASLALLRTTSGGYPDLEFPFVGNFNHAICYIDIDGGLLLDGTVDKASIYDLPEGDRDTDILIIKDDSYKFIHSKNSYYSQALTTVDSKVLLDKNGNASIDRTLTKHGPDAVYFRNTFTSNNDEYTYLGKYWNYFFPGSTISNLTVSDLTNTSPVTYSYRITVPHFTETYNDNFLIPVNLITSDLTKSIASNAQRSNDLVLDGYTSSQAVTTFSIPDDFYFSYIPDNFSSELQGIKFSIHYKQISSQIIEVTTLFSFSKKIIPKTNYSSIRSHLVSIDAQQNKFIQCRRISID